MKRKFRKSRAEEIKDGEDVEKLKIGCNTFLRGSRRCFEKGRSQGKFSHGAGKFPNISYASIIGIIRHEANEIFRLGSCRSLKFIKSQWFNGFLKKTKPNFFSGN